MKNSLVHKISINNKKTNCLISIRLDDKCKNGHEDFSITADFWTVGEPRTDRNYEMGGCRHEEILKIRPDLKPFVDLHLCDWKGIPMYASANGYYHLTVTGKETAKEYLRATDDEINELSKAASQQHFGFMLVELGITNRWESEANNAINLLEEMTGEKFQSTASRTQLGMTDEQLAEESKKVNAGHYTPEAIKARTEKKEAILRAKKMAEIEEEYKKAAQSANKIKSAKIAVLDFFGALFTNYIVYNHSQTVNFNWKSYEPAATIEQIEHFKSVYPDINVTIDKN